MKRASSPPVKKNAPSAGGRITAGFFVDWLDDSYQQSIVNGMTAKALELDINLLIYDGGAIRSPRKFESNRNIIYEFAKQNLDGLIILSGAVGHFVDHSITEDFCRKYMPLPVLSISYEIKKIPSLFTDNRHGIREIVLHFVKEHKAEKIAFIAGPESSLDSEERLAAYLETLKECGIYSDPSLIVHGEFTYSSGVKAAATLLDERNAEFSAIIAANDDMALGAMEALKDRGFKIPDDIAVGGFDNNALSKQSFPPLTTVDQSFSDLGSKSVELIALMIRGKKLPPRTNIPARLIIRESCGCFSREVTGVELKTGTGKKTPGGILSDTGMVLSLNIHNKEGIPISARHSLEKGSSLLKGIHDYLDGKISSKKLLLLWNEMNKGESLPENYFTIANMILNEIRRSVYPYTSNSSELQKKAENFFHQLRIIIGERSNAEEKKKIRNIVQEFWTLHDLNEEMLDIFDIPKMTQVLAKILPQLGIPSSFITRFEDNLKKSRIVFGYNNENIITTSGRREIFSSENLLPEGLFPADRRYTYVIEDLCHHDQLGVAFFEMGPQNGRIYGELRRVISTRLHGAILSGQLQAQEVYLKAQTHQLEELRKVMGGVIQTLSITVEARDPYTAGHQRRVADLARSIASEMHLPKDTIEGIRLSSIVHDLGKIYVPAEILTKPGKLLPEEFNLIKVHPQVAYDILKTIDFPWPIAEIVYQHHERINGSGYPQGLTGDKIKLEARIIAVADVVEAMASHRPYRPAIGISEALNEIRKNKGILYDADAADACINVFENKGFKFKY